jgi:hypothetical protein
MCHLARLLRTKRGLVGHLRKVAEATRLNQSKLFHQNLEELLTYRVLLNFLILQWRQQVQGREHLLFLVMLYVLELLFFQQEDIQVVTL